MSYYIVYLELARPADHHPILAKLSNLRFFRATETLWFVEYLQGPEALQDFLFASLYDGDGVLVHPMNMALLGSYRRAVQEWIDGKESRRQPGPDSVGYGRWFE